MRHMHPVLDFARAQHLGVVRVRIAVFEQEPELSLGQVKCSDVVNHCTLPDLRHVAGGEFIGRQQRDVLVAHVAQYIGQVGQRVHFVEFATLDQRIVASVSRKKGDAMTKWQATFLGLKHLPRALSDFEIEASFTFTLAERQLIEERRRPALKLGLALQIGFLRMSGRLLDSVRIGILGGIHEGTPNRTS